MLNVWRLFLSLVVCALCLRSLTFCDDYDEDMFSNMPEDEKFEAPNMNEEYKNFEQEGSLESMDQAGEPARTNYMEVDQNDPDILEYKKEQVIKYKPPSIQGLEFVDLIDDNNFFKRWSMSTNPKFVGQCKQQQRLNDVFTDDKAIVFPEKSQFYGLSTKVSNTLFQDNKNKPLVVSYQVKYSYTPECGGAYIKLFNEEDLKNPGDHSTFDNLTPYVLMFGPDICSPTNKIHVIVKPYHSHLDMSTEHSLGAQVNAMHDLITHAYTLHLKTDNTYEIYVDLNLVKNGSILKEFTPPFVNESKIPDPEVPIPETWETKPFIEDPYDVKPDDWDEDESISIADPNAVKPSDWLEDVPKYIDDPEDIEPENWDHTKKGPWKRRRILNPVCEKVSGCGTWIRPFIPNPKYRGKWKARMIENPNYQGEFVPEYVDNPYFINVTDPYALAPFTSLGIEIWTVHNGTVFDNFVISRDISKVLKFVKDTVEKRSKLEAYAESSKNSKNVVDEMKSSTQKQFDQSSHGDFIGKLLFILVPFIDIVKENSKAAFILTSVVILITLIALKGRYLETVEKKPTKVKSKKTSTEKVSSVDTRATDQVDISEKEESDTKSKTQQSSRNRDKAIAKDD